MKSMLSLGLTGPRKHGTQQRLHKKSLDKALGSPHGEREGYATVVLTRSVRLTLTRSVRTTLMSVGLADSTHPTEASLVLRPAWNRSRLGGPRQVRRLGGGRGCLAVRRAGQ